MGQRMGLTDEQINEHTWMLTAEREYEAYTGNEFLVVNGADQFAHAIAAPLLKRIVELEQELASR